MRTSMANGNIITGQYVRIEQPPAKTVERFVAFVIDLSTVIAYLFVCYSATAYMEERYLLSLKNLDILIAIPAIVYPALMETLVGGQTLGKWLMKIRVVKVDGSSPDVGSFLLRWMILPVDLIFFGSLALFSMLVTANRQRLGDLAAGTMVIKLNTYDKIKVSLDEFAFVKDGYHPFYAEAATLSAADADRIARLLADRSTSRGHRMRQLVPEIEETLNVSSGAFSSEQFLALVLSDYRYFDFNKV